MSYNFCTDIAGLTSVAPNCQATQGYESVGWIIERENLDFAASKLNEDNKSLIETLAVKTGKTFCYLGQLKDGFRDTTVSLNQGSYRNTFTHTVSFKVFENSAAITRMINGLANGEYVMVLEQKHKSEFGEVSGEENVVRSYRVFGWEQGLSASSIDNDNYSEDVADGWSVSLEETSSSSAAYYMLSNNISKTTQTGTDPTSSEPIMSPVFPMP